jgi:ribosome-binding factor A
VRNRIDRTRRKHGDYKTLQLCRQVFRALSGGLSGENDGDEQAGDDVLRDLAVHSVLPAPDATRLLVNVYLTSPPPHPAPDVIRGRLARAAGRLRAEVAAAIVRKRAPELTFNLLPAAPGEVPSWE